MHLLWLELHDFRSYPRVRLEPDPGTNLVGGANATGKTNLLEAVAYLSSLTSFRRVPDRTLIREGSESAIVRAEIRGRSGTTLIEVEIPREGRRRTQVNRQPLRRGSEMLGHLRTVAFLPDDLDVVKRGPARRRDLFDEAAVQLWPGAHADQQEYAKALRQRNALLRRHRRGVDPTTLQVWDIRLAEAGARVMHRRVAAIRALLEPARAAYRTLAGRSDELDVRYESNWGGNMDTPAVRDWEARLGRALERSSREDQDRGVTTVGPHRDDPSLFLNDREVRSMASQGEQRCVALALRLALHQAIVDECGERPVLLLDDVFSELDTKRAAALTDALPGGQSFVTSARDDELHLEGRRWTVVEGAIR